MSRQATLDAHAPAAKRVSTLQPLALASVLAALLATSPPAMARGCLVLLCFAAPSWRAIPGCVPPVRRVLRDLARGRPFPVCSMSGPGNSAYHRWAYAPGNCPPQYTRIIEGEGAPTYSCDYTGAVAVNIEGALWARTWWSFGGDTVTDFTPAAKSRLGTWDTRFDDDHAAWLATLPPPPVPCPEC